jgi:hypothetical protein
MNNRNVLSIVLGGILMFCAPAFAHHGTGSSYDSSKTITLTGVVTKFAWSNPHSQLYFDVTDDQGNVVHWGGEMSSPGVLARAGWTRNRLKTGDKVTLIMHPSLVGTPVGVVQKVVFPDGTTACGNGCGGGDAGSSPTDK